MRSGGYEVVVIAVYGIHVEVVLAYDSDWQSDAIQVHVGLLSPWKRVAHLQVWW